MENEQIYDLNSELKEIKENRRIQVNLQKKISVKPQTSLKVNPSDLAVKMKVLEKSGTMKMKPQHYDRSDDWEEYLTQFEISAEINQWNDVTKALYLAGSFKGAAWSILNNLKAARKRRFQSL